MIGALYRLFWSGLALLVCFQLGGCVSATLPPDDWQDVSLHKAWPAPPERPRVQLLRVVAGRGDLPGAKDESRFVRWLVGKKGVDQALVAPYGITSDGAGRFWVADPGSALVHVYDSARGRVDYIVQAVDRLLVSPVAIVYDRAKQRLLVADSGLKQVISYSLSGEFVGVFAEGFTLQRPAGMALAADGSLYVADVLAGQVYQFSSEGKYLRSIGSVADASGLFHSPSNVAVDGAGNLYVVDSLRFRVEVQSLQGDLIALVGGIGTGPGYFARPRGIAIDSDGHLYVADAAFDNVQVFDLAGNLLLYFGVPGAEPGQFCLPAGLHFDENDRLYVSEACNHRVQVFHYLGGRN